MPIDSTEIQKLPPIVGQPTDQHAQLLFAMGEMKGELKGVRIEMEGLKDAKLVQNGKVDKMDMRVMNIEKTLAENKGQREAFRLSWSTTFIIATIVLSIVGLIIKYVHSNG